MVAFSSQFSASDNAAFQLLGPTRVFPAGGHSPQAWSAVPRPGGGGKEWVRLAFSKPVWPSELHVFETVNLGSRICPSPNATPRTNPTPSPNPTPRPNPTPSPHPIRQP